jgi:hypothetical protein
VLALVPERFSDLKSKNDSAARQQWLTSIILATWEAEIRRIAI